MLILAEALQSLSAFSYFTDADRAALLRSFDLADLRSGDLLSPRHDDSSLCLGIVLSGALVWESSSGRLANLWSGSSFGDFSSDHRFDSTVTLRARGLATVALLTRKACLAFLSECPDAGVSLLRAVAYSIRLDGRFARLHRRSTTQPRRVTTRIIAFVARLLT